MRENIGNIYKYVQREIHIAATMGYRLGSEESKEVAYYKQIKEEMK